MVKNLNTSKGTATPLGATLTEKGVNFAISSANAKEIYLCLFSQSGKRETHSIKLKKTKDTFHIFIKDLNAGQLYAYRVNGEFAPEKGLRFNKNKLLIDPYAKELKGELINNIANHENKKKNNQYIPKCVVIDESFNWEQSSKPKVPRKTTFIYEAHVKGLTMLHPDVPKNLKGKFLGVCHPSIIKHIKNLGITTIELQPIQSFVSEGFLTDKGLTNYWGYDTLNYFSVHNQYGTINEFKTMVKTLHENGIELILDVVFNHTCEGNNEGPIYSFKGIDNSSYYLLDKNDKSLYINDTGCGNTFNTDSRIAMKLILDCMNYFSKVCQVDGFRFDLATTLIRDLGTLEKSRFLEFIRLNPEWDDLKLIAEPWDIGEDGYQLGRFKKKFCEWNDVFRRSVRSFWKGSDNQAKEFAKAISGNEDIFKDHDRQALSSINFITVHDGFTLQDLVSYNEKHNKANKENNRDGNDNNNSSNYGKEGNTSNQKIINTRIRQKKNLMATNIMSKGVPMILSGDEIGNSQQGNNNVYCQDNKIAWINWDKIKKIDWEFNDFIKNCISFRLLNQKLIDEKFLTADNTKWYSEKGSEMNTKDWDSPSTKAFGLITSQNICFLFNAKEKDVNFKLPFPVSGEIVLNTNKNNSFEKDTIDKLSEINLPNKSILIIKFK